MTFFFWFSCFFLHCTDILSTWFIVSNKEEERIFPEKLHEGGIKKLSRKGMVPARTWRILAEGLAPTERFILGRQVAAQWPKTSTTSLSLSMEACGLEEEELSILATQYWAEGVCT